MTTFRPRAANVRDLMKQKAKQSQALRTRHAVDQMNQPDNTRGLRPLKIQPNRLVNPVPLPARPKAEPQAYIKPTAEGDAKRAVRNEWDSTGTD